MQVLNFWDLCSGTIFTFIETTQKISKFTVVLFSHIAKLYLPYDFSDIKYNILDIKNIVFLEKLHYNVSCLIIEKTARNGYRIH